MTVYDFTDSVVFNFFMSEWIAIGIPILVGLSLMSLLRN